MALKTNRVDRHKLENAEFDFNRGREGQIQARKNAKGEVELVAFFGGKWYYCPMAEFSKTLNLRHGAQIDGSDVMTASQTDSSGFNLLRLNAVSNQTSPKLHETVIFVDEVPATIPTNNITVTFAANATTLTYVSGDCTRLKVGLNATNFSHSGSFLSFCFVAALLKSDNSAWVDGTDADADLATIELSHPTTAAHSGSNDLVLFGTLSSTHPNVFLNILYHDKTQTPFFYHKFQLNQNYISPFTGTNNQVVYSGQQGGGGGTGSSSGGGSGSGGSGGPR